MRTRSTSRPDRRATRFTGSRRTGETRFPPCWRRRGRDLSPRRPFQPVRDYQSRSLDRSDTSPNRSRVPRTGLDNSGNVDLDVHASLLVAEHAAIDVVRSALQVDAQLRRLPWADDGRLLVSDPGAVVFFFIYAAPPVLYIFPLPASLQI